MELKTLLGSSQSMAGTPPHPCLFLECQPVIPAVDSWSLLEFLPEPPRDNSLLLLYANHALG